MRLFFRYVKQRANSLLLFAVFAVIYHIIFAIYDLPFEAVVYPTTLCAFIGTVYFIIGFARAKQRHDTLCEIMNSSSETASTLPPPQYISDSDYNSIITLLCNEMKSRESSAATKYSAMIDYYTTWAHQIKTPIASMRLRLQQEDTPLSRSLSSDLLRIDQYADMVMTFLRLDSESTDYVLKEYALDPIICQAVRKYAPEFIMRKLTLDYKPVDVSVVTDEKWLLFVIEQLLSNALKYTLSGSVSIYIEAPRTLCIADTGIGIAPEDLPRIFERGYTGINGRDDKKASGIGLYLCRRICRSLGHSITASSSENGTVIRIDMSQTRRDE